MGLRHGLRALALREKPIFSEGHGARRKDGQGATAPRRDDISLCKAAGWKKTDLQQAEYGGRNLNALRSAEAGIALNEIHCPGDLTA